MPVDSEAWRKELNLSNFVNCYSQYRDLQTCAGAHTVLVIGPGQGLVPEVLRWRGYEVTTFDIDPAFSPDVRGSVHEMSMFCDGQFDAVIASHVLEHLAVPYLDPSLKEIARVGRHALIYLPVAGRHCQVRVMPDVKRIDLSIIVDVFNRFHEPDGVTPRYAEGQHFWEVGMRGFRVRDIKRRLSVFFDVLSAYRNRDWAPSLNFVLRSKIAHHGETSG
jgi:predicted SAM-dependent methyltransferase